MDKLSAKFNPDTEVDPGYAGVSPANYLFALNPYAHCFVRFIDKELTKIKYPNFGIRV